MFWKRLIVALVTIFAASTGFAHAADTWLPSFNSGQKIYSCEHAPLVQLDSKFEFELNRVAKESNLEVYVIVTETGSDVQFGPGSGPTMVRKVWDNWTRSALFSERNALVILMTGAAGSQPVSIGARAGSRLNAIGINRDTMNAADGPVRLALRGDILSIDASRVPLRIVEHVNTLIKQSLARQTQSFVPQHNDPQVHLLFLFIVASLAVMLMVLLLCAIPGSILGPLTKAQKEAAAEREAEREAERLAQQARTKAESLAKRKELWKKLEAMSLDDSTDSAKIRAELCDRLKVESSEADELICEYKKFIFLCATAGFMCTPSNLVDEVWHLHLVDDTEAYYSKMCGAILGQIVHHDPSMGGEAEDARHAEQFKKTRQAYISFFGEEPNPRFWS